MTDQQIKGNKNQDRKHGRIRKEICRDLQQAKDVVKNLMEPYKETQNSQQSIVDYCVFLLNEKGKL